MALLSIQAKVKISDGAIVFQDRKVHVWKNTDDDPIFFTIIDIPPGSERILLRPSSPSSNNDPIYVRPQDIFEYIETK